MTLTLILLMVKHSVNLVGLSLLLQIERSNILNIVLLKFEQDAICWDGVGTKEWCWIFCNIIYPLFKWLLYGNLITPQSALKMWIFGDIHVWDCFYETEFSKSIIHFTLGTFESVVKETLPWGKHFLKMDHVLCILQVK